jgi:hypothetical protein
MYICVLDRRQKSIIPLNYDSNNLPRLSTYMQRKSGDKINGKSIRLRVSSPDEVTC